MSFYIVNNAHLYKTNTEVHNFNTRYDTNLHLPTSDLTEFQKGAYYSGLQIFTHLPANMKWLPNDLEQLALP